MAKAEAKGEPKCVELHKGAAGPDGQRVCRAVKARAASTLEVVELNLKLAFERERQVL